MQYLVVIWTSISYTKIFKVISILRKSGKRVNVMKRLCFRLICVVVLMLCSTAIGVVVDAADYGLKNGVDAVAAISKALEDCRRKGATKLVIPKGTYDFHPDRATEKYLKVSNNDNGLRRIAFDLEGFKDFEIDGQGSKFIMHGRIVGFEVFKTEKVTLRNFSIDWKKPFYFQAEVIAVNADENSFDMKVFKECDYEILADELIFVEKAGKAVRPWKRWAQPVRRDFGWEQSIDWNIWYDSKTMAPAYKYTHSILRSYNEKLKKRYHAKEVKPGVVRVFDATNVLPKVGWVLVVKGRKEANRVAQAIHVSESKDFHAENIDIYHANGMGFIAERSENISLEDFNVILPPNSGRMVTTTADATHFVNCRGMVSLNNCMFENMLDDAANFHGIYTNIEGMVDDYTIGVNRMHGQQVGFNFAQKGDKVRLCESKNIKPYATLEVASVQEINEEYMEIRFTEKVSDVLRPSSVADNISWEADVRMTNCTVRRNRARSILISTAGDVLLEKNLFQNCDWVALQFAGDATFWYESGPVRNVVIRNNRFKNLGVAVGGGPLIHFVPRLKFDGKPTHYYHQNVVFENNTCEVIGFSLANLFSVENFVFKGNTVKISGDYPMSEKKNSFNIRYSKDVRIEDNDFQLGLPVSVHKDKHSKNIVIKGHKGLTK